MLPLVSPSHNSYNAKAQIHPDGLHCQIYSDRAIIWPNYTLVDLSRSHFKTAPENREPWGDKPLQLYSAWDYEMKENLMSAVGSLYVAISHVVL